MDYLADTVFLIDLWRESRSPGPATAFARENAEKQLGISWIVAGEFLAGAVSTKQDQESSQRFLSRYPIVQSSPGIIRQYAELYAELRSQGQLIGPNDLWVAAVSLYLDLPLITRNRKEFSRVTGLKFAGYGA